MLLILVKFYQSLNGECFQKVYAKQCLNHTITCWIELQDRAALTEKFKEKLLKYMASRLKIQNRDSETCLTYNWIQVNDFFTFDSCP